MKGNKRYKPKPIKRHDHTGALVNYGVLEVGIVAGIRCLGSREALLLIGAGLAKQKVPDYFYALHHVRVMFPDQLTLKIYAIKSTDASSLANRISARVQLKKAELINADTGNPEEFWVNGEKAGPFLVPKQSVKMEPVQMKVRPKRAGKFHKAWLLVKRLFWK